MPYHLRRPVEVGVRFERVEVIQGEPIKVIMKG